MSDTHSIASTSSAPIFSADDRNVDFTDPNFESIPPSNQLGSLPYSDTDSHSYLADNQVNKAPIIPGNRSNPVSLDFLNSSPSLLYSFTDPAAAAPVTGARGKEPRSGITNSFGVPPGLFQPRNARSRQLRSVSSMSPSTPPANPSIDDKASLIPRPEFKAEEKDAAEEKGAKDSGDKDDKGGSVDVPDLAAPIDSKSRDVTPTPESNFQDVRPASVSLTSEGPQYQTSTPAKELPHTTNLASSLVSQDSSAEDEEVPVMASMDSDIETASVVSIQQLTETYLHDPSDSLTEEKAPVSNGGKIPFTLPAVVATSNPPTPLPISRQSSNTPSVQLRSPQPVSKELSGRSQPYQHANELPSPSKLPAHISRPMIQSSVPNQVASPSQPDSTNSSSKEPLPLTLVPVNDSGLRELETKLVEEQKARTYLEGQLEAVKEECEAALSERPKLLSKLSRAEAELEEMAAALERERSRPNIGLGSPKNAAGSADQVAKDVKEALGDEKRIVAGLKSRLADEEKKSDQLETELKSATQNISELESNVSELKDKYQKAQGDLVKKTEEAEGTSCKLLSLEAEYQALEKNKNWLHSQLQEAQKTKLALQEELRDCKATGITHSIKCDQLQGENSALQEQITDMLKGVLQEKEKMVSELETIQADVLSHEDLYAKLIAENAQLESAAKRKEETISQLSSDIAKMQVEKEELKKKADESDRLSHAVEDLQKENNTLSGKLATSLRNLEDKDSDLNEMERVKNTLQERLRQTDAELAGKDGTIQSFKDANELQQQELALVNEAKEAIEKEAVEAKRELAMLEAEVRSSRSKNLEKELQAREAPQSQYDHEDLTRALQAQLKKKDKELRQREEAFQTLEAQTNELLGEFNTLKDNFNSIASESGSVTDSIAEKDRVISHLVSEKEKREGEIGVLEKETQDLRERLGQLQHERAHLLGKVEGAIDQDEFKKLLQDKTQLQDDLNVLRVEQKRDEIKAQSKINQLETDLREAQSKLSKAQKELEAVLDRRDEELSKAKLERGKLEHDLKSMEERMKRALDEKKEVEESLQQSSVKPSEQSMHEMLRSRYEQLRNQNEELAEQVQLATQQKAEVERASGLVASKLKQNAEKERKELLEKNREVSLELERLRGRLAGMTTTQTTMRDHATTLEINLAKKESAIVKLSAELQKALDEKQTSGKALRAMESKVEELNTSIAFEKKQLESEKQRVEELEKELCKRRPSDPTNNPSKKGSAVLSTMTEQLTALSLEKEALQSDVSYLKSQLLIAKTSAESAKRQIADKNSQVEILDSDLKIAKSRCQQAEEEVRQLREHLKAANQRKERTDWEGSFLGRSAHSFEGSPSRFSSSTDEVDHPGNLSREQSTGESGATGDIEKMSRLNETLSELGSRVAQARQQGEEAGELKKSGEILVLKKELGTKSKTLSSLQSYLHNLKEDMNKLHRQMDHHSAAMKQSYKSSRLIESQIEDLRRNSSLPSPLLRSTPTESPQ